MSKAKQDTLNLPFGELIKTYISKEINKRIISYMNNLRQRLSEQYPGCADAISAIIAQELYTAHVNIRMNIKRSRQKKLLQAEERCHARISSGERCSRKKTAVQYCKVHQNALPYGSIEEETIIQRKRGRRCKTEEFQISEEDMDKYVQAIQIYIGEERYLLDQHDILYTENNLIVGTLVDGEPQWCQP